MRGAHTTIPADAGLHPFRNWGVLAAVFLTQMLAIGSTSFGFGLFIVPVSAEFGIARSTVNQGMILFLIGMAAASPLVGRALDRYPARWIMLGGAAMFGLGALMIAVCEHLWLQGLAMFGPLAFGATALGPIMASTVVAQWFDQRRGRALGIAAISMSVGGAVVVPGMAELIERGGWQWAVGVTGMSVALLSAVLALTAVPGQRTLEAPKSSAARASDDIWTPRILIRTRDFWLLVTAVGILMAISQSILSSIIAHGTDSGLTLAQASGLITAISISSIIGKLLIGSLSDIFDKRLILAGVALLLEGFLVVLLTAPTYSVMFLSCVIAGAAVGGTTPVWTALISARFGVKSFGTVIGFMAPLQMPIGIGALYYIGFSHDMTGSYTDGFTTFAFVIPLAFVAALLIARPATARL